MTHTPSTKKHSTAVAQLQPSRDNDRITPEECDEITSNWRRYWSFEAAIDCCHYCRRPITIAPKFKGVWMGLDRDQGLTGYDMTYQIKCGSRLAEKCPACSQLYSIDANRLVALGLFGDGENVPLTVSDHPQLFFTLTVPSFGRVHHYVERQKGKPGICHPGKKEHDEDGARHNCGRTHEKDDPLVGTPICPDHYDFAGQVLANAMAGKVWNRFYDHELKRCLARELHISKKKLDNYLTIEAVKTVEMQTRLAVHYHGFIRLDGPTGQGSVPLVKVTDAQLVKAFRTAAAKTVVHKKFEAYPKDSNPIKRDFRFGVQMDAVVINDENAKFFAWYAAKYATKAATEAPGFLSRFRSLDQIEAVSDKHWFPRQLAKTAWAMGADPRFDELKLRQHAHTFGFGGHFISKSRNWSVDFADLKVLRRKWAIDHIDPERPRRSNIPPGLFADPDVTWAVIAVGWDTPLEARAVRAWYLDYKEACALEREQREFELGWERMLA